MATGVVATTGGRDDVTVRVGADAGAAAGCNTAEGVLIARKYVRAGNTRLEPCRFRWRRLLTESFLEAKEASLNVPGPVISRNRAPEDSTSSIILSE